MFLRRFFYEVDSRSERLSTALAMDEAVPLSTRELMQSLPVGTLLLELLSLDAEKLTQMAETCPQYAQVKAAVEAGTFPLEQADEQYLYYQKEARDDPFFASLLEQSRGFEIYSYSSDEFLIYEILHFAKVQKKYREVLRLLREHEETQPLLFYDYLADEGIIPHADTRLAIVQEDALLRTGRPAPYGPASMGEDLNQAYERFAWVSAEEQGQELGLRRRYYVSNFDELFSLGLSQALRMGLPVKPCENCGKYFIPKNRSDALYCYRPSPQNPEFTCRDYRLKRAWYDRSKADEVEKLSKSVYQTYFMRAKRRPDDEEFQSVFKQFSQQRSQWRKDVKAGKATAEQFKAWLLLMREALR